MSDMGHNKKKQKTKKCTHVFFYIRNEFIYKELGQAEWVHVCLMSLSDIKCVMTIGTQTVQKALDYSTICDLLFNFEVI